MSLVWSKYYPWNERAASGDNRREMNQIEVGHAYIVTPLISIHFQGVLSTLTKTGNNGRFPFENGSTGCVIKMMH
jgi:hypothetical protein